MVYCCKKYVISILFLLVSGIKNTVVQILRNKFYIRVVIFFMLHNFQQFIKYTLNTRQDCDKSIRSTNKITLFCMLFSLQCFFQIIKSKNTFKRVKDFFNSNKLKPCTLYFQHNHKDSDFNLSYQNLNKSEQLYIMKKYLITYNFS